MLCVAPLIGSGFHICLFEMDWWKGGVRYFALSGLWNPTRSELLGKRARQDAAAALVLALKLDVKWPILRGRSTAPILNSADRR
jgi:hypothetical protein